MNGCRGLTSTAQYAQHINPSTLLKSPPLSPHPSLLLLLLPSPQLYMATLRLKIFRQVPAREPSPVCMIELA